MQATHDQLGRETYVCWFIQVTYGGPDGLLYSDPGDYFTSETAAAREWQRRCDVEHRVGARVEMLKTTIASFNGADDDEPDVIRSWVLQ